MTTERDEVLRYTARLAQSIDEMEWDLTSAQDTLWDLIEANGLCPLSENREDCCQFPYDCEKV